METINVKFDELIAMASKHDCLEPELQRFINSSAEEINTPSKEDLDNLFGPMFEEYFEKTFSDTPINSATQPTQIHEDSPSTSLIIVNEHEAPPIMTTSDEQTSPISLTETDEFNQEDSAHSDGNSQFVSYNPPSSEEIEDFKFGNSFHDQKERMLLLSNGSRRTSVMLNILWFETKLILWLKDTSKKKALILKREIVLLLVLEAVWIFIDYATHKEISQSFKWMLNGLFSMVLYGKRSLKQAPRAWYDKLSSFLIEHGFIKDFSKRFANLMKNNFEMSMMGELKFFLGLQVHQSPRGIFISQSQYAIELLKKHGLDECVSMSTPMATERLDADLQGTPTDQTTYRRMIGGLMYLTASRPDIAFATFVCARYQARPTVKHLKEVKRIFRYLRQSYNMGLWYPKDSGFELIAYLDADHAGCKDDCKSTSGGLQFLGGKLVSWSSKKQDCTALSTAEAEYVSLSACYAQVIWMRTQMLDYGYKYNRIPMYCDSKSTIAISCNLVQHSKIKHIDIWYHFSKEHVLKGIVEIYFVGTEYQLADLFTKTLPKDRFEYLVHRIGMRCMTPTQLESLTKLSS
ncbi:retrovirus-related pol polyprotein from transposon TNT 1-94 [Tanacetum coccineum]